MGHAEFVPAGRILFHPCVYQGQLHSDVAFSSESKTVCSLMPTTIDRCISMQGPGTSAARKRHQSVSAQFSVAAPSLRAPADTLSCTLRRLEAPRPVCLMR